MKEKIGFFGGCFNPPSNIHIKLATSLIEQKKLDKVIFVPVGDFYSKENLVEFKHRFTMLKFAIEKNDKLFVDDFEDNTNKKMYAIDAFKFIENKYKENDIYFIMGSDNYNKMENWKEYDTIKAKKYKFIILKREENQISSTQIRKMIKENNLKENILSQKVYDYIKKNKLYV